jgi:hypothetical protein
MNDFPSILTKGLDKDVSLKLIELSASIMTLDAPLI